MIIHRIRVPVRDIVEKVIKLNQALKPGNELSLDAIKLDQVDQSIIIDLAEKPVQAKDKV